MLHLVEACNVRIGAHQGRKECGASARGVGYEVKVMKGAVGPFSNIELVIAEVCKEI